MATVVEVLNGVQMNSIDRTLEDESGTVEKMELTYVISGYYKGLVERRCRQLGRVYQVAVAHSAVKVDWNNNKWLLTLNITGMFDNDEDKIQGYAKNLFDAEVQTNLPCSQAVRRIFELGRWAECFENKYASPVEITCSSEGLAIGTPTEETNMLVQSAIFELIAAEEAKWEVIKNKAEGDDLVIWKAFQDAFTRTFNMAKPTSYDHLSPGVLFVLLKWINWFIHFPDPLIEELRKKFAPPDLINFDEEIGPSHSAVLISPRPKPLPFVPSSMNLQVGLRPIIIDAANVAMKHGCDPRFGVKTYSFEGLYNCADFWMRRGHTVVVILRTLSRNKVPWAGEEEYLERLKRIDETDKSLCVIVWSNTRMVWRTGEDGSRVWTRVYSYDDNAILQHAESQGGAIVSNDHYDDLLDKQPGWRSIIEQRVIQFRFDRDVFVPFVARWAAQRRGSNVPWEEIVKFSPGEEIPSLFQEVPPPPPGYQNSVVNPGFRRHGNDPISLL